VHYTRGAGLSSNSERFMLASLFNIEALGQTLKLPREQVGRKRTEILFHFSSRALFERDLPTARRLFWQTFARDPTPRHSAHLLISAMPKPVLDGRRKVLQWLERTASRPSFEDEAGQPSLAPADDTWPLFDAGDHSASIFDQAPHKRARLD